ncbi:hypothetical protein NC651_035258 [Populus alba x Populus x berolinensis]|nr:hypothetical protein NC651_035255 [Populus alba x Populus x berolinensis]KAJ6864645.1 hypothetical protein NC651_035258 [Populus alba x Populus x berolinensis]
MAHPIGKLILSYLPSDGPTASLLVRRSLCLVMITQGQHKQEFAFLLNIFRNRARSFLVLACFTQGLDATGDFTKRKTTPSFDRIPCTVRQLERDPSAVHGNKLNEIAVQPAFLTWTQHKKISSFTPVRQYTASVCSSQRTDIYTVTRCSWWIDKVLGEVLLDYCISLNKATKT